jgi:hypothetical protein
MYKYFFPANAEVRNTTKKSVFCLKKMKKEAVIFTFFYPLATLSTHKISFYTEGSLFKKK